MRFTAKGTRSKAEMRSVLVQRRCMPDPSARVCLENKLDTRLKRDNVQGRLLYMTIYTMRMLLYECCIVFIV